MILQRATLAKLTTADSTWDFSNVQGAVQGMELYIRANTVSVETFTRKGSTERFRTLVVRSEDGKSVVPVEMLEFSNLFRIEE